jgi:hypothetical protein
MNWSPGGSLQSFSFIFEPFFTKNVPNDRQFKITCFISEVFSTNIYGSRDVKDIKNCATKTTAAQKTVSAIGAQIFRWAPLYYCTSL